MEGKTQTFRRIRVHLRDEQQEEFTALDPGTGANHPLWYAVQGEALVIHLSVDNTAQSHTTRYPLALVRTWRCDYVERPADGGTT